MYLNYSSVFFANLRLKWLNNNIPQTASSDPAVTYDYYAKKALVIKNH